MLTQTCWNLRQWYFIHCAVVRVISRAQPCCQHVVVVVVTTATGRWSTSVILQRGGAIEICMWRAFRCDERCHVLAQTCWNLLQWYCIHCAVARAISRAQLLVGDSWWWLAAATGRWSKLVILQRGGALEFCMWRAFRCNER